MTRLAPRDWRNDPRAAFLLATFAHCPPQTRVIPVEDRWTLADEEYCGDRVTALKAINADLFDRIDPMNTDAQIAFVRQIGVQEAVRAAVEAGPAVAEWREAA